MLLTRAVPRRGPWVGFLQSATKMRGTAQSSQDLAGEHDASVHPAPSLARVRVGTAGWSIPRSAGHRCGGSGTHLHRYARAFNCVEINSSFHRPHRPETYARWAGSTPAEFRFSVKVPKEITHVRRLRQSRAPLRRFLDETSALGAKRGPLLVQLPPSFEFDARVTARFFSLVRSLYDGPLACEPRHPSWFGGAATLLARYEVAQVAADPACTPAAREPGGWSGLVYYRLHGRPRTYWSAYSEQDVDGLATAVLDRSGDVWCIFDNTAAGAAIENAWQLRRRTRGES